MEADPSFRWAAALFGIISACWGGLSASSANIHPYKGYVWSMYAVGLITQSRVVPNGNRIAGLCM